MTEFDDDELRDELRGLAPDVDESGALTAPRPLARRARSRHRARLATITAGCIVLTSGTAVALTTVGDDRLSVTPATSPQIAESSTTTTVAPETTTTPTTATVTTPSSTPNTTPDSTPHSTRDSTPDSTPSATPDSTPGSTPGGGPTSTPTPDDHGGGNDAIPDSGVRTFTGDGGSINVRVSNGALVLVAVNPAEGYKEAEDKRDVRDDRIRVEFGRKDGENQGQPARVEVRIINGEVRQTPSGPPS